MLHLSVIVTPRVARLSYSCQLDVRRDAKSLKNRGLCKDTCTVRHYFILTVTDKAVFFVF